MSQIRDHGEKFVRPMHPHFSRPCTLISDWIAWSYKKLQLACAQRLSIQFEQSRYAHTHTLDSNRENHRKSKEIKIT